MNKVKPYEKYKDSGIAWLGEIPEHWRDPMLKRICQVKRGASPRPIDDPNYFDAKGEFAWVRISDVTKSKYFLNSTQQKLSELGNSKSVKIYPGEIFLSIAGSVGKPIISNIKCCIHDGFVYFENLNLNRKYMLYMFLSGQPYKGLGKMGTQLNLNTETVGTIVIPLPPSQEQTAIANFLDYKTTKIDRFIFKKKQLIKLLNEQKAGFINEAVTKGLNPSAKMKPSGIEWLGDIPEAWEVRKLKYVANCFPSNIDKHSREGEKQVRLCNYTDVYKNDFITNDMNLMIATATDDQIEKFSLQIGDVIITKDSETANDIAVPAVVKEELENVVCGYHLSVLRPHSKLIGQYLFRVLQCKPINIQFEVCSNGVTRVGLGVYDMKKAQIPVPPLSEQTAIVSHIEKETAIITKTIATIEKEIALVQEYRTALIAEAVTGKIDVRDYEVPSFEEEKEYAEMEEEMSLVAEDGGDDSQL